jgi:two-component system chemotaxis response regulator CheB
MGPIRVLVVDDSLVIRQIVKDVLAQDPGIQVIGAVANGEAGVQATINDKPDVVILDVEMPRMNGVEALKLIRAKNKTVKVIMFSSLTSSGASVTIDALAYGASDYVTKPSSGGLGETRNYISSVLVAKIKALHAGTDRPRSMLTQNAPPPMSLAQAPQRARPRAGKIDIVAIGVSTGGPQALREVIAGLPKNLPVPVVIVQHMPEQFTKLLADRLNQACPIDVAEATPGEILRAGTVRIARGGIHMVVQGAGTTTRLNFDDGPPENSCKPAVDPLFRSVAKLYGPRALGIVLTGMGSDGALGAVVMRDAGAHIIAQDQASCVVWGMPRSVVERHAADVVLPLERVAREIATRAMVGRVATSAA